MLEKALLLKKVGHPWSQMPLLMDQVGSFPSKMSEKAPKDSQFARQKLLP